MPYTTLNLVIGVTMQETIYYVVMVTTKKSRSEIVVIGTLCYDIMYMYLSASGLIDWMLILFELFSLFFFMKSPTAVDQISL